jgi:IS4 transposase
MRLTSLTDRRRFKAADIVSCYERRWQIETRYHEFKQSMLGTELTRTLGRVTTEMSLQVSAYNLKRVMNILGVAGMMRAMKMAGS